MVNAWLPCKPEPDQRPNGSVPARTQRASRKAEGTRAPQEARRIRDHGRAFAWRACSEYACHGVLVAESVPRQRRRICLSRYEPSEGKMPKEPDSRGNPGESAAMTGRPGAARERRRICFSRYAPSEIKMPDEPKERLSTRTWQFGPGA
jgi:hypothetical protein